MNSLNTNKDHDIRHWEYKAWLGTGTKCGFVKLVNGIATYSNII
jgi:hypothetical protein